MDLLVVLSTTTAYFASLAMMILDVRDGEQGDMQGEMPMMTSRRGTFFDSSVFLIMFILGGRALEAFAKAKVRPRGYYTNLCVQLKTWLCTIDYKRDRSSRFIAPSNRFGRPD